MSALLASWRSMVSWRARRPLVRRRLRETLAAECPDALMPVRVLVHAAGLEGVPRREIEAALTDLVNEGVAEGLRGPRGWSCVRGRPARTLPRYHDDDSERVTVAAASISAGTHGLDHGPRAGGGRRRSAVDGHLEEDMVDDGFAPGLPPARGSAARGFSVGARIRRRRSRGLVPGLVLCVVALGAAAIAAQVVLRHVTSAEEATASRAGWYEQVAREYVRRYLAGNPGYGLPFDFAHVSGVSQDRPRGELERGMERYVQVALFTGFPSYTGLLAWARHEFGELPAGPGVDAWLRRAAETYAARALQGAPGYDLTPVIHTIGGLAPDNRDPAAVTTAVRNTLRAALFTGGPEYGGVLDWARRTFGDLPRE